MVQKSFASLEDLASNMRKGLARTISLEKAVDGIKTGIQRLKEGQLKLLFGKKEELGHAIGKEMCASLAILDSGLAEALVKQIRLNGGSEYEG